MLIKVATEEVEEEPEWLAAQTQSIQSMRDKKPLSGAHFNNMVSF